MKLELHNQNISIASFVRNKGRRLAAQGEQFLNLCTDKGKTLNQEDTKGVQLNDDHPEDSEQLSSS